MIQLKTVISVQELRKKAMFCLFVMVALDEELDPKTAATRCGCQP